MKKIAFSKKADTLPAAFKDWMMPDEAKKVVGSSLIQKLDKVVPALFKKDGKGARWYVAALPIQGGVNGLSGSKAYIAAFYTLSRSEAEYYEEEGTPLRDYDWDVAFTCYQVTDDLEKAKKDIKDEAFSRSHSRARTASVWNKEAEQEIREFVFGLDNDGLYVDFYEDLWHDDTGYMVEKRELDWWIKRGLTPLLTDYLNLFDKKTGAPNVERIQEFEKELQSKKGRSLVKDMGWAKDFSQMTLKKALSKPIAKKSIQPILEMANIGKMMDWIDVQDWTERGLMPY